MMASSSAITTMITIDWRASVQVTHGHSEAWSRNHGIAVAIANASAPQASSAPTSAEIFHTDERLIVFGHLESTTPRA